MEDLAPLEQAVLTYLLSHPYVPHSHDDLITNSWSEVENTAGVSTEAVYQVARRIRLKIEPDPTQPMYLVTRRGGYQFFPEGRPDEAGENAR
ncbi:MAG: winged helix-turn-helix domain-containing protein [Anaerolineales bacterium]|nr:winged helix-turn-helix domain-containing protein [Anaerolineales bacterium]MCB8954110.1 winged helix-turn-helix domain-containing protein [Ardenticatenales bacterium]